MMLVIISPLLALILGKNVLYGTWQLRLHVITGALLCTLAISAALLPVFDGLAYGDRATLALGKRAGGGFRTQLLLPSRSAR